MPESNTPMGLSLFVMKTSSERRHLITELFFAGRRKAEDLLPDFARLHAKINLDRRRLPANPFDHLSVHLDSQRLEVTHLAVRAEHLLAGQKPALRITLTHHSFKPGRFAQHPEAQPGKPPPVDD